MFPADIGSDRLGTSLLAKICQQQQKARQTLFAGVEKLIDQILFDAAIPGQQISHEQFGELWLLVKGREHGCLRYRGNQTIFHRSRRCDAQRMAIHAPLTKELAWPHDADYRFLPLLRYDNDLDPAVLNIKDRVGRISLSEDDLALAKFKYRFPFAYLGEKFLVSPSDPQRNGSAVTAKR
jgi:hypothetical protein